MESMSGFAEPFNLVAILGVSKSGKSTLLNALSGRLSKDMTLAGEIFFNGKKQQLGYGTEAYLTSKDICNEMLTVQENMYISAMLKLPSAMAMKQRMNIIDQIMADLGLQHCASRQVGQYSKSKCLTRGERRRLVLAMELVMRPRLLYLDDATSGLDSSEALLYMTKLKVLAREGRTVIACCGEFNQNIFNLFDYVLVLGGHRTIYFGEACSAAEFFMRGGLYSSVEQNTVKYFLQVQAPEYEEINASMQLLEDPEKFDRFAVKDHENIQKNLIAVYEDSDISARMRAKLSNILSKKGLSLAHLHRHPNFADQIAAQMYRSFLSITRDIGHYWTRLILCTFAVVMVGTIFFNLDHSIYSIQERATCLFLIFEMTVFITVGAIPFFFHEMEIFESDRFNEHDHYHALAFIIGMFLSSIPYLLITSLLSSAIGYFLIGLHRGAGHFSYLFLDLLTSLLVSESCMKNVAIIVGNSYIGMVIGSCIQTTFMLVAGYTSRPSDIPKPVWKYPTAWISFHRYGLTGLYQNEFIGLEFKHLTSQMSGEQVVESIYHMKHPHKWNNILILLFMLVIYHFLQYICIMKKRSLSTLWSLKIRKLHSMWKIMLFNK